jgi:DNA-binding response OmpR family regulator
VRSRHRFRFNPSLSFGTRSEILLHVWDSQLDGGSNLIDVYINRLRLKVDQNGFAKLIHTARGLGYRLGIPEQ